MPDFWQAVEFSHMLLEEHIDKGDMVVDATVGNGHDTVFLANLVGENGQVISFDIQREAIENTRDRLVNNKILDRVKLIEDGHQFIDKYLEDEINGMVFNLGYLPGGDKDITTGKKTTTTAVEKGLKLLKIGGIIILVIYTGHPGGQEELKGVLDLAESLNKQKYNVLRYNFINQGTSPQVLAIIRRK